MFTKFGGWHLFLVACAATAVAQAPAEKPAPERPKAASDVDRDAKRLYDQAVELLDMKQHERGLGMLQTVARDHQGTLVAHMAHMAMGKHHLEQRQYPEALNHFLLLSRLLEPKPGAAQSPQEQELHRESLFNAGLAHYEAGQYAACFPLFRRVTEVAEKTPWANKAYFYIGMSHYQLKNWNKAIDSLSLVGTEVEEAGEEGGETLGRIEIGERFYAKIEDADIPIMRRLGQPVRARVQVASGDDETIEGAPVPGKDNEMLASAPTALGLPKPGDGVLQMVGGDLLTVTYVDDSTVDGQKGVARSGKVKAVSTGVVGFYLGDLATPASVAYPGQPQVVMLRDGDLDKSPAAETVTLTVTSRYKVEEGEKKDSDDLLDIFAKADDKESWRDRDSVVVTLTEVGEGPEIRSGIFAGKVQLAVADDGTKPDPNDAVLNTQELDELVVKYTDAVHLHGDEPRETEAKVKVSGSVNSGVSADQYVVFEELLKSRKGVVEAEALVGLGAIYKDMGLDERAGQRARESLERVDPIIVNRQKLPGDIVETAFRLKWESELLKDDFESASATCLAFNRLYPESVLADQALMALGRSLVDRGDYAKAVVMFGKVLQLQNPISAAEAQFRIGEALQKDAEKKAEAADAHNSKWGKLGLNKSTAVQNLMDPAIAAYRRCYDLFPESSFAAEALGRVVRHYVDTENFAQASELLQSVFKDYPDAAFLDDMLMLWANVAFRMGDNELAKAKLRQLVFDYPASEHLDEAQRKLAGLEGQAAGGTP
jgi:TolA-binding protein